MVKKKVKKEKITASPSLKSFAPTSSSTSLDSSLIQNLSLPDKPRSCSKRIKRLITSSPTLLSIQRSHLFIKLTKSKPLFSLSKNNYKSTRLRKLPASIFTRLPCKLIS